MLVRILRTYGLPEILLLAAATLCMVVSAAYCESIWQCPEVIVIPVARIGWCCKRATERAGRRPVLVTRRFTRDEARQIAADVVGA